MESKNRYNKTLVRNREENKLRVLIIGAHPDDNTINAGGTAALFVHLGHEVKFISLTNGDAGHQSRSGEELAGIRKSESREARDRLGISEYTVWNIHDGELLPSLENRNQLIREIRNWQADIVIGHRPWDYHPDHRSTGALIQDSSYLTGVPNIAPDTPSLKKMPLFLYSRDPIQKPYPFRPDIAIDITNMFEKKIYALDAHRSQMYEWGPWINGADEDVPENDENRLKWLIKKRTQSITAEMETSLGKWYGKERIAGIIHAEAFEISEYGRQPTEKEIRLLFPMLPAE